MPIPQNSHSLKLMVTFIENSKIGHLEQINCKARLFDGIPHQKALFSQDWTPVWYLLLRLVKKSGLRLNGQSKHNFD